MGIRPGNEDSALFSFLLQPEPKAKLRVERNVIAEVLSSVLANHTIEDISVEDPPLEDVIAEVFAQTGADAQKSAATTAAATVQRTG